MKCITSPKIVVAALLMWHFSCVLLTLPPLQRPANKAAPSLAQRYLRCLGQAQVWTMFAPNPVQKNLSISAVVYFDNGHVERFAFPRVKDQRLFSWSRHAWRKYQECLSRPQYSFLRQDAARYILRQTSYGAARALRVGIYEQEADTSVPKSKLLFSYHVKDSDLP